MAPEFQVVLSCSLSMGVPVLLGIRELVLLRRHDRRGGWRDTVEPPSPRPLPRGGETSPRPLPDCLIPKPFVVANATHEELRVPELV